MAHHITRKKGKNQYHYLADNVKVGKKWKKIKIYLGSGKLTKKELKELIKKNKQRLEKKIDNYLRSVDPLYAALSKEKIAKLKKLKSDYQKAVKELGDVAKEKYESWFTVKYTYDTNRIEGSTLSEQDVSLLLYENIVPEGKSLSEIHEATNHKKAYEFLKEYKGGLTFNFILKLHSILMKDILEPKNCGNLRKQPVYIRGADFIPPKPENVKEMLSELIDWYKNNKNHYHPVAAASYFHEAFEGIHPFIDGNGRTGRLLINYILLKNNYPAVNIKSSDKAKYIDSLKAARKGRYMPLVKLIANYLLNNQLVKDYGTGEK